jgi:hypothetical protein
MENLGRGTVAVKSGNSVFISWRILGLEFNAGVKYNLYRGGEKIASDLNVSNYTDATATSGAYQVAAVVGGAEKAKSPAVGVTTTVVGNQPCIKVPIRVTSGYSPKFIFTGDLDGDGEFDFVFDKQPNNATSTILVEAYKQDGTFLWQLDCGPNSVNRNNISPGSSALDCGHGDNFTVYDVNNDGKSEVIIRTANGVKFGDGTTLTDSDNSKQFISVLSGMTGKEIARAPVPTDFLSGGPMNGHMGIAYLDGVNPSIIWSAKNRPNGFNMMTAAWTLTGTTLALNWKVLRPASEEGKYPDGHQIRCLDVDGDGKDEVFNFGHVIDHDGTYLYSLAATAGIVHGDRFSVGDLDPNRPGLEGYAIQQNNPSFLMWALYDAKTGAIIHSQSGSSLKDQARGAAFDFDPRTIGYELYTFTDGLYNVNGTKVSNNVPDSYPNLRIWWDGDLLSENLDNFKMTKWDYAAGSENRLFSFSGVSEVGPKDPGCYGDILGDWREEAVYTTSDNSSLAIFTTTIPTDKRLYTLLHDPEYRNCLTNRGYYQSAYCDFYLGEGMTAPPTPNIKYVGGGTGAGALPTNKSTCQLSDKAMKVLGDRLFALPGRFAGLDKVITVFDVSGRLVKEAIVRKDEIRLQKEFGLSNKTYFVLVNTTGPGKI